MAVNTMDNKVQRIKKDTSPRQKLEVAARNAKLLADIVDKEKWSPTINGKKYLQFEAWQTLGSFYNLVPKITETKYVEYGNARGFEARAVVIDTRTGQELGAGEGICMTDEAKQSRNPLYVLKGMAQTRACSRAMRQMLAYIAVLAGYEATPSEEMTEFDKGKFTPPPIDNTTNLEPEPQDEPLVATANQKLRILKLLAEKGYNLHQLLGKYEVETLAELSVEQADTIILNLMKLPGKTEIEPPITDEDMEEI